MEGATRPTSVQRPGEARARAALTRHASDQRILEQAAEIRSQRLHAPFLDNQVVRACRDLPESLRVRPGARAAILRAVLAGAGIHELPAGWGATTHASSTAAARKGLRVSLPHLISLFDAPLLADAGLVEARVVRKALRAASEGESVPLDGLAELISTELWLRRLLSRRGTCWTGAAAPRQRAVAGGSRRGRRCGRRGRGAEAGGADSGCLVLCWVVASDERLGVGVSACPVLFGRRRSGSSPGGPVVPG